jgi:N-acetylneuraminate synthase
MSTLGEIEDALAILVAGYAGEAPRPGAARLDALARLEARATLAAKVTVLHCTSAYPAPVRFAHLRAMDTIARAFGVPVGYSDHTPGIAVSIAAAARGASVIEKHFTLDRALPGPDHRASLEPAELTAMVAAIRDVEAALGGERKAPTEPEFEIRAAARKSLVAARRIERGAAIQAADLAAKRPAGGLSPMEFWSLLGRTAARAYEPDDLIEP